MAHKNETQEAADSLVKGLYGPMSITEVISIIEVDKEPLGRLRQILIEQHLRLGSWRRVGDWLGISAPMARLIADKGHYPGPDICRKVGLPVAAQVVVIGGGDIPPGAQVVSALRCACGQWFVPNHPRRRRCFICSPFRGRQDNQQL